MVSHFVQEDLSVLLTRGSGEPAPGRLSFTIRVPPLPRKMCVCLRSVVFPRPFDAERAGYQRAELTMFVLLLLLEPAGKPATSASSRPDTELHKLLASPPSVPAGRRGLGVCETLLRRTDSPAFLWVLAAERGTQ